MINITETPGLKILVGIIVGFLIGNLIIISDFYLIILMFSFLIISLILIKLNQKIIAFAFISILIGLWISYQTQNIIIKAPNKIIQETPAILEGKIVKILKNEKKYLRAIVDGEIDLQFYTPISNTKTIINIFKTKRNLNLISGQKIAANCYIRLPKEKQLSTDFSEKQYASSLDVQFMGRASSNDVAILSEPSGIYYYQEKIINEIQKIIQTLFPSETEGIVCALITGDKSKISYETRQKYALTGTAHLLAVSGLHVGVIAGSIFLFLSFIKNRWLKFVIFTFSVTSFVFISGFQPSAIRAGAMAIVFLFVSTLQRRVNFLNLIIIVGIFFILINPSIIYSVGFQMSFGAVTGIALFYNPILNLLKKFFTKENWFVNSILNSFALTTSCSILVSPLVSYYFGIFSLVSPLANLIVVPLMVLAMLFSIIAVIISLVTVDIALIYSASADFLIKLCNNINDLALQIPYSHFELENFVWISISISVLMIYILLSKTKNQFAFRFIFSIISIILFLTILPENKKETRIIPRENIVFAEIPLTNNKTFILLSDRRPKLYPLLDFGILKYLQKNNTPLIVAINGNNGIKLTDALKKTRKFKKIEISLEHQRKLSKILKTKELIPQIIELEN